jgi:hypothetical protein
MSDFWPWTWRVLVLGAVGIVLLVLLSRFGVLTAIGDDASGLLGMLLGAAALFGALVWLEAK